MGSDLRELAAVANQLVSDSGGEVDARRSSAPSTRGRAEVSGFAVADLAVVGRSGPALEALRYALDVGVPHVVIADALADGVRSVARVCLGRAGQRVRPRAAGSACRRGRSSGPRGQARGWSEPGLRQALGVVATLNADVKGAAVDPGYALEHAIRRLGAARAVR